MSVASINSASKTHSSPEGLAASSVKQDKFSCLFKQILAPNLIKPILNQSYTAFGTTDDFGTELKRLRFAARVPNTTDTVHLVDNMQEIAQIEGFDLVVSRLFFYIRDHYIKLPNGQSRLFSSQFTQHLPRAIERSFSLSVTKKECARACTAHSKLVSEIGTAASKAELAICDYSVHHNVAPVEVPFYFEGGDVFTLTNLLNKRTVFMGKSQLAVIHCSWRLAKMFDKEEIIQKTGGISKEAITKKLTELSNEKVREIAAEMYALGLILDGVGCLFADKEVEEVPVFKLTNEQFQKVKPIVAKFMVERQIVLQLLSENFAVPSEDIHFVPEACYHLDTFMMPGPGRIVFVQDYKLCLNLLSSIQKNAQAFLLTPADQILLNRYIFATQGLQKELGELIQKVQDCIKKAHFHVVGIPGFFADVPVEPYPTSHIHFLNGISGWSSKNKRPYFITLGAKAGDNLGNVLMGLFAAFLKEYEPSLHVHFVGRNQKNPKDFSPSRMWWNGGGSGSSDAGVHCLSFDESADSHTYSALS
jgi:hypothetical protein